MIHKNRPVHRISHTLISNRLREENYQLPRIFVTTQRKLATMLNINPRDFTDIVKGRCVPCDLLVELLERITGVNKEIWRLPPPNNKLSVRLSYFFFTEKLAEMEFIKGKALIHGYFFGYECSTNDLTKALISKKPST